MSRPFKCRRIAYSPNVTFFKPAGVPLRELEEVRLSLDECEAIRLKNLEGLDQEKAAEKMNISRPTFQRILASAHRKLTDVILNGKAVRIEGGNIEISPVLSDGEGTANPSRCCQRGIGWKKRNCNFEEIATIQTITNENLSQNQSI